MVGARRTEITDKDLARLSRLSKRLDEKTTKYLESLIDAYLRDPNDSGTLRKIGAVLYLLKEYEIACPYFRAAVHIAPEDVELWLDLSASYLGMRDFKAARDAATKATSLDSGHAGAWKILYTAQLQLGDFEAARDAAREEIRLKPTASGYSGLGVALMKLGELSEAEEALQQAVKLDPKSRTTWKVLAELYEQLGHSSEAERCKQRAKALRK